MPKPKSNKNVGGRPSIFSQEIADAICERLTNGEPLARICDDDKMPAYTTVRRWEDENEQFRSFSTRARVDGTHKMADDCLRISDDMSIDPGHKRFMIDTRLRLIGKWNRKVYGDKQDIEHSGSVSLASLVEASLEKKAT